MRGWVVLSSFSGDQYSGKKIRFEKKPELKSSLDCAHKLRVWHGRHHLLCLLTSFYVGDHHFYLLDRRFEGTCRWINRFSRAVMPPPVQKLAVSRVAMAFSLHSIIHENLVQPALLGYICRCAARIIRANNRLQAFATNLPIRCRQRVSELGSIGGGWCWTRFLPSTIYCRASPPSRTPLPHPIRQRYIVGTIA